MIAKLVWIEAITQRPAIRWRTSRSASRRESASKRSASSSPRPMVLPSMIPETESDSWTRLEMSAIVSCVVFAIRRRSFPTRRVSQANSGISAKANSASSQLSTSMPIIVATTVVRFEAIEVAVLVTTFWTPPMSFEIRDCTSPVRVRVKNASERRCRCRKTEARRSCMTRWPTWFESSVCTTPRTPVTIAIAIIPPAATDRTVVSLSVIASRMRLSRKAGRTPSPAETTISSRTPPSRSLYGAKSRPMRRRFAWRRAGSAGRSGASSDEWKNMPIRLSVRRGARPAEARCSGGLFERHGRNLRRARPRGPDQRRDEQRARDEQADQDVEAGLEAVVERRSARGGDAVNAHVVAGRARGDGAHRGDPECAADLAARIDQARGDARVGALDAREARDRDGHERQAHAGAAEHEAREDVPEVVPVDRQARQPRDRDRGDEHDGQREGEEGDAALDGRVVQDVLEVQRQQEELRESDAADDRHRDVRTRERPAPEDAQRQQRRRRAKLDRHERKHKRGGASEERQGDGCAPAVARSAGRRVDEQHQARRDRDGAREVEVPAGEVGAALAQEHRR